ncbi:hypothetical protein BKA67DRAFT_540519 [Truncatella angustata]|uniref:Uncharacterized protein n=1 Tax=Truncatella angustata TaxID=152316 RepID=A0A9P8UA75_9PEZI|nr:uncharacterized protein BKA67DRAFT_540519 [Truncatella angustata]KAH6647059.1 hypothetical protein BKA67DRAFT_540519 [Truncatella angustata]
MSFMSAILRSLSFSFTRLALLQYATGISVLLAVGKNAEPILLPFIRALGDGSDVLPVLLIGQRGGKLSSGFQGPENTRGFDYFPRDHILHSADLFIFNAGYGGAGHVIGDGGPIAMVGHSWGRQKSLHE